MAANSGMDWKMASLSFDPVADLYEKYRPGYPQELVDRLLEQAGISPSGRILEIGAGTGKATQLFAERGYPILCIEPGRNLAAIAARALKSYPGVQFEINRFEDWPELASTFDLVFSAQAFHWVPKEVGLSKAARVLTPGGYLGLFWNMSPGFKGRLADEIDQVYREIAPDLGSPFSPTPEVIQQRVRDIDASGCFGPVSVERFPWSAEYRTPEYLGLLNTYSDHLRLPEDIRQELFNNIGRVIDEHGGSVEKPYIAVLYVAKKAS
jgi:SAM-dependent methyltransferase